MPRILPGVDNNKILTDDKIDNVLEDSIPFVQPSTNAVIESDDNSMANVFIFAAFADKRTGILYSNLPGTFPLCHSKKMCVSSWYTTTSPTPF
jgi:hypothetical protein